MLHTLSEWLWRVNQLNHYMPAVVQPGFTRSVFSAHFCVSGDATMKNEPADTRPIVLCIDTQCADQNGTHITDDKKDAVADVVTDTFQAAIALAGQDPLLQCVSSWLQQDLDWCPIPLNTPISVDMTLSSAESAAHKIGLAFGPSAPSLPVFPVELDGIVKIQEHKQSLRVCLAQLPLSEQDRQRVQPGSCIVLPDTFKAGCRVELVDLHTDKPLAHGYLDRSQNQLRTVESVASSGRSAAKPSSVVVADGSMQDGLTRIVLKQPITVDMAQWLGHSDEPAAAVQVASLVGQAVLVQAHKTDRVEEYNAQLIEVGSGLAVVLESTQ